jgi:uncharacterized membrane protein
MTPQECRRYTTAMLAGFGFLYAVLIPPLMNPDEDSHFCRVHAIATGNLFPDVQGGVASQKLPVSLIAFRKRMSPIAGDQHAKYPYAAWYIDSHSTLPVAEEMVLTRYATVRYTPVQYIPQVAGYLLGHVLFFPFHEYYNWPARILMARLGALACAVAITWWSLGRLPALVCAFSATALLPMATMLAAAVSSDTVLIYACMTYAATIVRMHVRSERCSTDMYALLISAFVIGSVKFVYLPLVSAVILLKPRLSARDFRIVCGQVAAVAVAALAFNIAIFFPLDAAPAESVQQIQFLREHPGEAIRLPWRSLIEHRMYYFISAVMNFGSLDTNLAFPLVMLAAWVYLATVVLDTSWGGVYRPRFVSAVMVIAASVCCIHLIFWATYVHWTSVTKGVGVAVVDGVQGRYFLPLIFNGIACLPILQLADGPRPESLLRMLLLGFVPVHLLCALAVIARYWIC